MAAAVSKTAGVKNHRVVQQGGRAGVFDIGDWPVKFPTHDPTVRSAASIGRRLRDPAGRLVKVEARVGGGWSVPAVVTNQR